MFKKALAYLIDRFLLYFWKLYVNCIIKSKNQIAVFGINISLINPQYITVGKNVSLNSFAYLNGMYGIEIGNNVAISAGAKIITTKLDYNTIPMHHIGGKIVIGNNVQIGAGAIILPGVTIGNNVVVGAGAIVSKSLPANAVYVGSPAKKLKTIG